MQFKPAVAAEPAPLGWSLEMFNDSSIVLDPMDVMPTRNGSGGAPHTRCVSGVRWQAVGGGEGAPSMWLSSKDVPCVCTGTPTPFPTPRNEPPDMADGVSYNIYNNIWNTKCVACLQVVSEVLLSLARVALRCHRNLMAMPVARCSYVLWYPFAAEDADMKARFSLRFEG